MIKLPLISWVGFSLYFLSPRSLGIREIQGQSRENTQLRKMGLEVESKLFELISVNGIMRDTKLVQTRHVRAYINTEK